MNKETIQAESENYHPALVQIARQLKQADAQFRRTAASLLEMLSDRIGDEAEEKRLIAPLSVVTPDR